MLNWYLIILKAISWKILLLAHIHQASVFVFIIDTIELFGKLFFLGINAQDEGQEYKLTLMVGGLIVPTLFSFFQMPISP